jgi:hypothetical protein
MQRKLTRHSCWHLKLVRPVYETGQTAFVGLSLSTGRGNRSDRFGKPVRPVLSRTSPKHLRDQNIPRTFPPLNKRSHSTTETLLLRNPSRRPTGLKPVRPVWETSQTGFSWTVGKNTARGKNSTFQVIDLPIRSTDQSETLGVVRVPCGLPLARSSVHKTHSIKKNRKSTLKNTFPWKPP